jgi:hypothetical protein
MAQYRDNWPLCGDKFHYENYVNIGRVCSTHDRDDKCIQSLVGKKVNRRPKRERKVILK